MGELKDLMQEKQDQGISFRQIAESIGINYHTLYTIAKTQYGKQLPKKENYLKLKEYFGEDFTINGLPLTYAEGSDKALRFGSEEEKTRFHKIEELEFNSPIEKEKFQSVVDILEHNDRTIIPSVFVSQEEKLVGYLGAIGLPVRSWFVNDHDGYVERINEETEEEKYTVADLNGEVIAEYDIKKNKAPEEPKEIFFKPGDIEELAKEERFKPNLIKEAEPDDELSQTVKYLIRVASEKLAKDWHSKQGELNSLRNMDPIEALKIIREKKLL